MHSKELQSIINEKLDDEVLVDIVRKKTGWKTFEIKNVSVGDESKKGDNYLSVVLKFSISATCKDNSNEESCDVHVIIKALPPNVARRKTFRSPDFFKNEFAFYNKVWPVLCEFQHSKIQGSTSDFPLVLASYHDGEYDFIAMEDLSFEGYTGIQRDAGLDYLQSQLILKQFAKFHATSYGFKHQKPLQFQEIRKSLEETYFAEKYRNWYENFQTELIKVVRDAIARELPSTYLEKFNKIVANDFFSALCKCCARESDFCTITHGDAWLPNFLILEKAEESLMQFKIIDFQLARYASLAMDIMFFLYTCVDPKVCDEKWMDLLHIYFDTFLEYVKKYGTDTSKITFDDFLEEIKQCMPFALGMSMEACTMSLLEDDEVADLEKIQGHEAMPLEQIWIIHPFKTSAKRQRFAAFFKHAVDNQLLDKCL